MKRPSLTTRLVAGVVLAQLLLAAGLVWAGIVFTRRQLQRAFDTGLQGRLMSVAALVRYPEAGPELVFDATMVPPARSRRHPSFYQVRDSANALVANSFPPEVTLPAPGSASQYWDFQYHGAAYRGLLLPRQPILDTEENLRGPPAMLSVYYAAPQLDISEQVTAAGIAIGVTSLVLLALTSLLAAWAIRRELDPLRELARQAAAISARNWRLPQGAGSRSGAAATPELRPLVEALERMLARLHAAHQQQRAFMADAAHHLKTPVAILKSSLQSLLQRPRERDEYREAAEGLLGDVERLEQLLQRMLRLARLEQWAEEERTKELPLAEVGATCQAAVERVQPLAQARGVAVQASGVEAQGAGARRLRADPDDLELVWVNLLENAVQHSPAATEVTLTCESAGSAVKVTVRDQGTGIAPEEAPYIFERFRRGADPRPNGFGLGLAIARAIVEAYGGAIAVEPQPPPGAALAVMLPAGE